MGLTRVAVVIPVHNRRETTLQCLRSLHRINLSGIELRIFVVDDGSTDGTASAINEAFPDVVVIPADGTLHYAGGTNRGLAAGLESGADFLLAMNDDTVVHENFLQYLIACARSHERSIIGALLLLWDEPHRVFQVGQTWQTFRGGWQIPDDLTAFTVGDDAFPVECLVGNCVLLPAEVIHECGFMDEVHFPHGWGDAQYFAKIRRAGWHLYVEPKARVWCEPNTYPAPLHTRGFGEVSHILFRNERNPQNMKRQFVARWYSAPSKLAAVAAFGVYNLHLLHKSVKYGLSRLIHR